MKWSWRIGALRGIGVYLQATFLILIGFVVLSHWSQGHSLAGTLAGVGVHPGPFRVRGGTRVRACLGKRAGKTQVRGGSVQYGRIARWKDCRLP